MKIKETVKQGHEETQSFLCVYPSFKDLRCPAGVVSMRTETDKKFVMLTSTVYNEGLQQEKCQHFNNQPRLKQHCPCAQEAQ